MSGFGAADLGQLVENRKRRSLFFLRKIRQQKNQPKLLFSCGLDAGFSIQSHATSVLKADFDVFIIHLCIIVHIYVIYVITCTLQPHSSVLRLSENASLLI